MLIDWFTVGAQALNFVILVWLLKRFLYKPILTAIDAREKQIAAAIATADQLKAEAQTERKDFEDKNKNFDQERDALMAKATLEVKIEREHLLDDARKAAGEMRTRQQTVMQENAIALADQLKRLAAAEVFDIARKVLTDLASADLEERLGGVFARLLRQLNPTLKASLGAVIKAPNAAPIVRSRFGLSTPLQASIRSAYKETFASDVVLSFESAPDSLCGIELTVGGQRLSWDIAQYLKVLEQRVEALLSAEAKRASAIPVQKPPPAGVALLPSPIVGPTVPAPTGVAHAIASG